MIPRTASAPRRAQAAYKLMVVSSAGSPAFAARRTAAASAGSSSTSLASPSVVSRRKSAGGLTARNSEPKSPRAMLARIFARASNPQKARTTSGSYCRPAPFVNSATAASWSRASREGGGVGVGAEGAGAGHGVVGVRQANDARGERYLLARESVGVARPVPVLVVMTHSRRPLLPVGHFGPQARAALCV